MPNLKQRVSKPLSRLAKTGGLKPEEIQVALEIETAVLSIITEDIHSGLARAEGHRNCQATGFENHYLYKADLRAVFYSWLELMAAKGLSAGPVLDVIIDGVALSALDQQQRKRKGWAKEHLKKSLALYQTLKLRAGRQNTLLTA